MTLCLPMEPWELLGGGSIRSYNKGTAKRYENFHRCSLRNGALFCKENIQGQTWGSLKERHKLFENWIHSQKDTHRDCFPSSRSQAYSPEIVVSKLQNHSVLFECVADSVNRRPNQIAARPTSYPTADNSRYKFPDNNREKFKLPDC